MITGNSYPYALVTGGSKGIGYAISEALAKRKFNLILVGRDQVNLTTAKNKLEQLYGVRVDILEFDVSQRDSPTKIGAWCNNKNISLKMLCNVAGIGGNKDYLSLPVESLQNMIDLNLESYVTLTLSLLPLLKKNRPSYILNVGSMAGFTPIPSKNLYSATKSAVLFFSYSLHYQLKEMGVSVSCLAPGPVFTKQGIEEDTKKKLGWFGTQMAVDPTQVGEIAIRETLHNKLIIVPGALAKIVTIIMRVLPTRLLVWLYYKADRIKTK